MARQHKFRMGFLTKESAQEYLNSKGVPLMLLNCYKENYCKNVVEILGDNGTITRMVPTDIRYDEESQVMIFEGTGIQYKIDVSDNGKETYGIISGYLNVVYNPIYSDPVVLTIDEFNSFLVNAKEISDEYKRFVYDMMITHSGINDDCDFDGFDMNINVDEQIIK